ncbi:hypothetical protein D3C87_1389350 [compost metagenome]
MKERILEIIDNSNYDASSAVLIGDRYYTDIKLGKLLNIDTVHVNTGEQNKSPEVNYEPTFEFQDISEFIEWQYTSK